MYPYLRYWGVWPLPQSNICLSMLSSQQPPARLHRQKKLSRSGERQPELGFYDVQSSTRRKSTLEAEQNQSLIWDCLNENLGGNNIHYLLIESSCSRLSRFFGVVANLLANPCATPYWYGQSKQLHLALSQLAHLESWLVGGLEHVPFFPSYWECHHPNWLIFFRGVGQPPSSWENINAGGVSFYQSFTPKLPDTASVDCNLRRGGARKGSHTDPGSKVWTKDGYCWLVICRWFCIILSFHGRTCWNPTWLMVIYIYVCRSWSHQCHHCKTDMSESGSLPVFFVVSIVDPTIKGAVFWWIWGNVVNAWQTQ